MDDYASPLLQLPDAVAGDGIDAPVAAHYGSLFGEQRTLVAGEGFVDLSHRDVIRVSGPDRLTWLHSLTTQFFEGLRPKVPVAALVLSPQGHVEHAMYGVDDGEAFTAHVEPGEAPALVGWLDRMRFMMRVEVTDVTDDLAVTWRPAKALTPVEDPSTLVEDASTLVEVRAARRASKPPHPIADSLPAYEFVPRRELQAYAAAAGPACGMWAFEALRIARGEPRLGLDTDHRTIPNEAGWIGRAVHLDKGCYRGQETVARVHTLGKPPRRLTMLHLDGSDNRLPKRGADLLQDDKSVGFVGTSARHHELGPIALAMVKRNVALEAQLVVDGLDAGQEVIVDPEVGLHVRPTLR